LSPGLFPRQSGSGSWHEPNVAPVRVSHSLLPSQLCSARHLPVVWSQMSTTFWAGPAHFRALGTLQESAAPPSVGAVPSGPICESLCASRAGPPPDAASAGTTPPAPAPPLLGPSAPEPPPPLALEPPVPPPLTDEDESVPALPSFFDGVPSLTFRSSTPQPAAPAATCQPITSAATALLACDACTVGFTYRPLDMAAHHSHTNRCGAPARSLANEGRSRRRLSSGSVEVRPQRLQFSAFNGPEPPGTRARQAGTPVQIVPPTRQKRSTKTDAGASCSHDEHTDLHRSDHEQHR
jgi:hypothetical protein